MMEKTPGRYMTYQKKIMSYLDGTLTPDEHSEFEAFVMTHPDFEAHIRTIEDEIELLKSLIPTTIMTKSMVTGLELEMKESVFNLLKDEPKTFMDRVKTSFEDWVSR